MIPKTIHYCWFGHNPKPKLATKCIKSWKKKLKGYKIIEWNEDNFDISKCPKYITEAYSEKKWAFVTDYVRLKVVYEHDGVYLDTDVQVIQSFDSLLKYHAFFGLENEEYIATGLGFGAEKGAEVLERLMDDYETIPFILANGYDLTPCPQRNLHVFQQLGFQQTNTKQILDNNIIILPTEYMCPIDYNGKMNFSTNTYSIHWFSASWKSSKEIKEHKIIFKKRMRAEIIDHLRHIPNRIIKKVIGEDRYLSLKKFLKKQ